MLADLAEVNWAPTFAFLDQQSTEVQWPTLEQLARHKRADKWKTELWLLCASDLLPRGLRLRQDEIDVSIAERITSMFGTEAWTLSLQAARENRLSGAEFRAELTNLMRWRLEQDGCCGAWRKREGTCQMRVLPRVKPEHKLLGLSKPGQEPLPVWRYLVLGLHAEAIGRVRLPC